MVKKFSVLMSVYYKEKAEYLKVSLDSVINQTVMPNEIVLVKDGPLTDELEEVIQSYTLKYKNLFNIVALEKNVGLGLALAEGIKHCSNELIARMDADDISREDRFEKLLAEFENDKTLDICGSHITEFEDNKDVIVAKRVVPLSQKEIEKNQRRRDSFNHMAVMYKKSAVMNAGNYQSCMLMEDTYLWVRMLLNGAHAKNIDDCLVNVRIGKDMYKRRGGLSYFKKYKTGRKMVYKTGYISWWDYKITLFIQFIVCLMPNKLRGFVFKKLLHKG